MDLPTSMEQLRRDRFESTASAGRIIPSASPVDMPLPIPEDPRRFLRREAEEVCVEPTFQNGSQNKHGSDMHRHVGLCRNSIRNLNLVNIIISHADHYHYSETIYSIISY